MFPTSFIIGAALGAVATYLYKDQPARQRLIEKSKQMKDKTTQKIKALRKKPEAETQEQVTASTT